MRYLLHQKGIASADGDWVWIPDLERENGHAYPKYADSRDHLVQI